MSLVVRGLQRVVGQQPIVENISLDLALGTGDILFVTGPSGCGKTLLLRAIAGLDKAQAGTIQLCGKTAAQIGYPQWRTRVMYVPQARVPLPGTPTEFYFAAQQFDAQRGRPRGDLLSLAHDMGLQQSILNQQWRELSGGQSQRTMIAICAALKPDVLLLDEPTSAIDAETTLKVERVLAGCGISLIWVSHDPGQPLRAAPRGRILEMPLGRVVPIQQLLPKDGEQL